MDKYIARLTEEDRSTMQVCHKVYKCGCEVIIENAEITDSKMCRYHFKENQISIRKTIKLLKDYLNGILWN